MAHPRRSSVRVVPMLVTLLAAAVVVPLAGADGTEADTGAARQNGEAEDDGIPRSYLRGIAVGDEWTYRLSGDQRGEIHNRVVGEGMKRSDFFERTYPAYEVRAEGHVESDELEPLGETRYQVRGTKWVRASDYATIQVEGQSTVRNIENSDAKEAFEAPLVDLVHPFTTGYEWVATSEWWVEPENRGQGNQGFAMTVQQRVRVEGLENVSVPAGEFEAWRLNYTSFRPGGGFALRWHVDEVCDFVREDRFDKDRELTHRLELVDHSCSALEVDQPVYDVDNVTLVSRGILGGPTGNEPPRPGAPDDGTEAESGAVSWLALLVVAGFAGMVVQGRRRRG